jgi:hypothetical protein
MENATIVKLGPSGPSKTSFEEAFGEYSEARGRGRARRNKRKTERQQSRIARRKARKKSRQEIRAEQQEARQARKDVRRTRKIARQEMGEGPENEMDEQTALETGNGSQESTGQGSGYEQGSEQTSEQGSEQGGQGSEQGGQGQGYSEPSQGENEGGYSGDSTTDSQEEWGGTAPYADENEGGASEDEWGGTGSVYENDNDDSFGAPEGTGEDSGFDGVMGAEDRFFELEAGANKGKVSPTVNDLTSKIEWNKELISRLLVKKARIEGANGSTADVNKQIAIRKQRISDLEDRLNKYVNFEGDYCSADGMRPNKSMVARRGKEVSIGRKQAVRQRMTMRSRKKGTPVAKGLNPQFGPNRIVVPAKANSYADGTGLNGLDLMNDYDAPDARYIELSSNAEGNKKKTNWVGIAIGAVVAVGAIWALKKYKVF